jgi:hypothetical protein
VARQASDSFADVKVMSASVASGAREASSVAESRQATDSTKALARAEQSAFERKVQQAAQSVPTPPRIIPEQQQAGAAASPPPSLAPRAERNRSALNAAVADAVAPVPSLAGACIELRRALGPGRLSAEPDSVRLLDEAAPERGDPSWRRARYEGTPPDAGILSWRQVDSVTVELHSRRSSADSSSNVLRFLSSPLAVRQAGDRNLELGGLPGVRVAGVGVAFAWRIVCR